MTYLDFLNYTHGWRGKGRYCIFKLAPGTIKIIYLDREITQYIPFKIDNDKLRFKYLNVK